MTLYELALQPFTEFPFMRRALVGCLAVSLAAGPVGCFLVLRRMSLMGYALSHAVLPGIAVAYLLAGLSVPALALGGFAAGLGVLLLAAWIARRTGLAEETSLAALYNIAIASGVLLIAAAGSTNDLTQLLFGNVLALDDASLLLLAGIASLALVALAVMFRPLTLLCFDPEFLGVAGGGAGRWHALYLAVLALVLVGAFQALGVLMGVALMILPAIGAGAWSAGLGGRVALSIAGGLAASLIGLLIAWHADLLPGPTIVLSAGALALASVLVRRRA